MWDVEISEIDAFIGAYKTLDGPMPQWIDHHRGRDWQLRWGIQDAHLIERGELCITCDNSLTHVAFVGIMNQKMFYRLDIVPLKEVHGNPLGAAALNLPAYITGPHVHGWPENREYVRVNGFGQLPYRRGIQALVQTVADGLAWVAEDLNLMVTAEQRVCDPPIQTKLL